MASEDGVLQPVFVGDGTLLRLLPLSIAALNDLGRLINLLHVSSDTSKKNRSAHLWMLAFASGPSGVRILNAVRIGDLRRLFPSSDSCHGKKKRSKVASPLVLADIFNGLSFPQSLTGSRVSDMLCQDVQQGRRAPLT